MSNSPEKTWSDVARDVEDASLDLRLGLSSPMNPKPQYDLAVAEFDKGLEAMTRGEAPVANTRRMRRIAAHLSSLSELVYSPSARQTFQADVERIHREANRLFDAAVEAFRTHPTPERAIVVQESAGWVIEATARAFPLSRPAPEYAGLFQRILDGLDEVIAYAHAQG